MIYRCANCSYSQYVVEYATKVTKPCEVCGSWVFWFLHLGFLGKPSHEVAIDCLTEEVKSPDPCDEEYKHG